MSAEIVTRVLLTVEPDLGHASGGRGITKRYEPNHPRRMVFLDYLRDELGNGFFCFDWMNSSSGRSRFFDGWEDYDGCCA